jgi:hypothetical protein
LTYSVSPGEGLNLLTRDALFILPEISPEGVAVLEGAKGSYFWILD